MLPSALYRCMLSLEAIENYARARRWSPTRRILHEGMLAHHPIGRVSLGNRRSRNANYDNSTEHSFHTDKEFWDIVLFSRNEVHEHTFHFSGCILSEWVARVPGLYWHEDAGVLRELSINHVEAVSQGWEIYRPLGKSQTVQGGIGTFRFTPDLAGNHLVSLSTEQNASSGIPAIISPEVWSHYQLREGDVLCGKALWRGFPFGWTQQFRYIKGIPRGYLVINNPEQVSLEGRGYSTQIHPCTVMEYYVDGSILFDFVYATADTGEGEYRQTLESFFENYRVGNERHGRYLIPADHNTPLFDAEFASRDALYGSGLSAQAQLRLIEKRVRENSFRGRTLDELVQLLSNHFSGDDLRAISRDIHISLALWDTGTSVAHLAVQLLDICLEKNKIEELVDALSRQYPTLFN